MPRMNLNRKYSLKKQLKIFFYFLFRYTYSLRTQLRGKESIFEELSSKEKTTIIDAVEQQIKWLDNNPAAKIDDYKKQQYQLELIVKRILSKFDGQTPNNTRSQSSPYYGEL